MSNPDLARSLLENARTIAVLGAHSAIERPAHYVPAYLAEVGYRVIPVNARFAGQTLFGERVRATLGEIDEHVDIVDIFRRPEHLESHREDLLTMSPRPGAVWLQKGIVDAAFGAAVQAAGMAFIEDRCTLADHRAFGLGPRAR